MSSLQHCNSYPSQAVQIRHVPLAICVILHEGRCSPFWSPHFFCKYQHRKTLFRRQTALFRWQKKLFQISRRNADFTNTHVVDCCGWFCVSFQIMWFAIFAVVVQLFESSWICYQREQLHVEAFVCLSLWFKVCTCPKLIEWQIRCFPSKSIVKGGPLSFSLSEEALKFDRILT